MNRRLKILFISLTIAMSAFGLRKPVTAQPCTGSDHLLTVEVKGEGNVIADALIKFYFDPTHMRLADNLRRLGIEDAIVTTGSNGLSSLALATGTYYAMVSASGFQAHEASVIMPVEGTCSTVSFSLMPSTSTAFDPGRTTVNLSKTRILANDADSTTLTIRSLNKYGSIAPYIPINLLTTHEGMKITHHATTTDSYGLAIFTLTGSVPGKALLSPILNSQYLTPVLLTLDPVTGPATATSAGISISRSDITVHGSPAPPNHVTAVEIVVTVRDATGVAIPSIPVALRATRAEVQITPTTALTDATGAARFDLRSSIPVSTMITATAGDVALNERPIVLFQDFGSRDIIKTPNLVPGARFKLPDDDNPQTQEDTTVYFIGMDGRRHPFLDERIYRTWYPSFDGVTVVSTEALSGIPPGAPVTYRPGVRLIKTPSSSKVYAISAPHALRWIVNEKVASALYGSSWMQNVDDVSESLMLLYTFGIDIVGANDYSPLAEQQKILRLEDACLSANGNRCP